MQDHDVSSISLSDISPIYRIITKMDQRIYKNIIFNKQNIPFPQNIFTFKHDNYLNHISRLVDRRDLGENKLKVCSDQLNGIMWNYVEVS